MSAAGLGGDGREDACAPGQTRDSCDRCVCLSPSLSVSLCASLSSLARSSVCGGPVSADHSPAALNSRRGRQSPLPRRCLSAPHPPLPSRKAPPPLPAPQRSRSCPPRCHLPHPKRCHARLPFEIPILWGGCLPPHMLLHNDRESAGTQRVGRGGAFLTRSMVDARLVHPGEQREERTRLRAGDRGRECSVSVCARERVCVRWSAAAALPFLRSPPGPALPGSPSPSPSPSPS